MTPEDAHLIAAVVAASSTAVALFAVITARGLAKKLHASRLLRQLYQDRLQESEDALDVSRVQFRTIERERDRAYQLLEAQGYRTRRLRCGCAHADDCVVKKIDDALDDIAPRKTP